MMFFPIHSLACYRRKLGPAEMYSFAVPLGFTAATMTVCIHIYMCRGMFTCTCRCACTCICIIMYMYMCSCRCTHVYVCVHVLMYMYICTYMCVRIQVCDTESGHIHVITWRAVAGRILQPLDVWEGSNVDVARKGARCSCFWQLSRESQTFWASLILL